ncbi:MAG: type II toxin-antitoxin system VapC family toxin [Lentisphaerae bacterium]|nr:type II toxin-antitoxin system VapC family toxin [Lentisphaerota bacterium]MBT4817813.1 type II toxin-antitoxin system VapC family toxin [Lentisphaerota bacterium]MBT5612140.1 type II toxin-antitoxin system VapC family toxin [Lentisphaerota bacterium]MBT7058761.1 type II toxin-antitoxin system VapC family toxin [Lentisphaerota bacterium]
MIGLDTNVLVRQIVQDDEDQAALAGELIEDRCTAASPGHIPLIVLCELVWVLNSAYRYSRSQITLALRQVLVTDCFDVEQHALAWGALADYAGRNVDYADCVIARLNRDSGSHTTFTFDKKAARLERFTLLNNRSL